MGGFWQGVERWARDLQEDRPRLARYLQAAWWVSNLVVLVGFVVAILVLTGVWSP